MMINWKLHNNLRTRKLFTEISISIFSKKISIVQLKISVVANYYSQYYCNISALKSDITDSMFLNLSIFDS